MHSIRIFAAGTAVWAAAWLAAAGQTETGLFAFASNTYSAGILDSPRNEVESRCPELFQPPAVGEAFAYRAFRGPDLLREISAVVVSSSVLDCADGPEIAIHPGQLRIDLFRALYLTDALHRTPQIHDEPPPAPILPPSPVPLPERP